MPLKHIGFDLDGTLIDTRAQIVESIVRCVHPSKQPAARALAEVGSGESPLAVLRQLGVNDLRSYWAHHARACDKATPFFKTTKSTLERLRSNGVTLSIITSLPARPALNLLRSANLTSLFDLVDTHSSRRFRKPSPQLLVEHLNELGVRPNEAAYVGDSEGDMQMAKKAGTHAWAVGWSTIRRESMMTAGAELIIDTIDELVDLAAG